MQPKYFLNAHELLELNDKTPKQTSLMGPLLGEGKLGMVYSQTGGGKTTLTHWLVCCAIAGLPFLNFTPTRLAKVLYIDGEMGFQAMAKLLEKVVFRGKIDFHGENLRYICHDTPGLDLMPRISDSQGQQFYTEQLKDFDVLVLDNLWTLSSNMSNESEFKVWERIEPWLKDLRANKKCVVLVHHANKSGDMSGGIRKQTILDWVMALKKPNDFEESITEFKTQVIFEKARDFSPAERQSLVVTCIETMDSISWSCGSRNAWKDDEVRRLSNMGMSDFEISKTLNMPLFLVKKLTSRVFPMGVSRYADN